MAEELLSSLGVEGKLQARSQRLEGDKDAWLWPGQEPPIMALMARVVAEVCGVGKGSREHVEAVAERLMGTFHLPAVREALGCLIPGSLHRSGQQVAEGEGSGWQWAWWCVPQGWSVAVGCVPGTGSLRVGSAVQRFAGVLPDRYPASM